MSIKDLPKHQDCSSFVTWEREILRRLDWEMSEEELELCFKWLSDLTLPEAIEKVERQLEKRMNYLSQWEDYLPDMADVVEQGVYDEWTTECERKMAICHFYMGGGIEC